MLLPLNGKEVIEPLPASTGPDSKIDSAIVFVKKEPGAKSVYLNLSTRHPNVMTGKHQNPGPVFTFIPENKSTSSDDDVTHSMTFHS